RRTRTARSRSGAWAPRPRRPPSESSRLFLAQPEARRAFGVELDLLLHEGVHLFDADIHQLEAALRRELLHLRVVVERAPEVGNALAGVGRRGLRYADAAVGAVDPVDAQLAERRRVGQQR